MEEEVQLISVRYTTSKCINFLLLCEKVQELYLKTETPVSFLYSNFFFSFNIKYKMCILELFVDQLHYYKTALQTTRFDLYNL